VIERKEWEKKEERTLKGSGHTLDLEAKETSAALNLNAPGQGCKPWLELLTNPLRTRENKKPFLVFHYDK